MHKCQAYIKLEEKTAELADIERVIELLNWDRSVKMPSSGAKARAEQLSTMAKIRQDMITNPEIANLIVEARENIAELSAWQQANLQEIEKYHKKFSMMPASLLKEITYQTAKCETIWEEARKLDDFNMVAADLEKLRELTIEKAKILGTGDSIYDALLDEFNSGCTYSDIGPIFSDLEEFLPNFLSNVLEKQIKPIELKSKFAIDKQKKLSAYIAEKMGYKGRLDTSAHPFSMGRIDDVRITSRYSEDEFILYVVLCVLHEAGHGLYDMQLPRKWRKQPVGGAFDISMAIHESQSMIWEMQIGHMLEFWQFITPKIIDILGLNAKDRAFSAENFCKISNYVELGHIRVDADEVTYPLHIIMRTKLEKAMIEGELQVKDLPHAWEKLSAKILGIIPPNDRLGCLQDCHWYGGCFGYFPAYLLGAMNAAQIFSKMSEDLKNIRNIITKGDFAIISNWLEDKIHKFGCFYSPKQLIYEATGEYLQVDIYKKHLKERYL